MASTAAAGYPLGMERIGRKFASFAAAERAERDYYRSLTPGRRMEILFELLAQVRGHDHEAAEGFPRVYRVVKRSRR